MHSLLGKKIVFLCFIWVSFASAAKVFPVNEKNKISQKQEVPKQQSTSEFHSIYEAKIDHVMEDNLRLAKQLNNISKEMELMKQIIENQTLSLEKNKINIQLQNEEFVAIINEHRNEIERLNRVDENQTLNTVENKLYIKQLNKEFAREMNEKSKEIYRLNQLSQSNEQKINACATRDEIDEMNTYLNSILDQIQKRMSSDVCDPNPCLNGGRCELSVTGSDNECTNCPSFSGKHCETLKCGNASACFQRNNMGYFVLESEAHVTWEEAKSKCLSEGMSLAQPKDNTSTEFLISQLQDKYDTSHSGPWFWIGFRYDANGQQWQWIDGSVMGDYTGNNEVFQTQTDNQCGLIYLYGHLYGDQKWSAHHCSKADTNRYHSLCEKRLI